MSRCFSCGERLEVTGRIGRGEDCPSCGADLHCCRNCQFYNPKAFNECREPMAERVLEKERSNFCDYFSIGTEGSSGTNEAVEAKRKLETIFGKKK